MHQRTKLRAFLVLGGAVLVAACSDGRVAAATGGESAGGSAAESNLDDFLHDFIDAGAWAEGGTDSAPQECAPGTVTSCWEDASGDLLPGSVSEVAQGACTPGERICGSDGTWDECLGAVGPAEADTCEPGDDSNCNGTINEGCACQVGERRSCADTCGEQICEDGGTWSECTSFGECTLGSIETDTAPCGNCGTQGMQRSCGTDCTWLPWESVEECRSEGACAAGQEETQETPCGNCGSRTESRICAESCEWGPWLSVSDECVGSGACSPGEFRAAAPEACGYCGLQGRVETCSDTCEWEGDTLNHLACVEENCIDSPGDERSGVVECRPGSGEGCADTCCVSLTGNACGEFSCPNTPRHECDGPEDCGGSYCCLNSYNNSVAYGQCRDEPCAGRFCHVDADCEVSDYCRLYKGIGHCTVSPPAPMP